MSVWSRTRCPPTVAARIGPTRASPDSATRGRKTCRLAGLARLAGGASPGADSRVRGGPGAAGPTARRRSAPPCWPGSADRPGSAVDADDGRTAAGRGDDVADPVGDPRGRPGRTSPPRPPARADRTSAPSPRTSRHVARTSSAAPAPGVDQPRAGSPPTQVDAALQVGVRVDVDLRSTRHHPVVAGHRQHRVRRAGARRRARPAGRPRRAASATAATRGRARARARRGRRGSRSRAGGPGAQRGDHLRGEVAQRDHAAEPPPRSAARVSPEFSNRRADTTVTATPAAAARSSAVGADWIALRREVVAQVHGRLRAAVGPVQRVQQRARRAEPTRIVMPTMPCAPAACPCPATSGSSRCSTGSPP